MQSGFSRFLIIIAASSWLVLLGWGQNPPQNAPKSGGDFSSSTEPIRPEAKIPTGVILVKGAWSSASDSTTPVPEGGSVTGNVFRNQYFGLNYPLPKDWTESYKGP